MNMIYRCFSHARHLEKPCRLRKGCRPPSCEKILHRHRCTARQGARAKTWSICISSKGSTFRVRRVAGHCPCYWMASRMNTDGCVLSQASMERLAQNNSCSEDAHWLDHCPNTKPCHFLTHQRHKADAAAFANHAHTEVHQFLAFLLPWDAGSLLRQTPTMCQTPLQR